MVGAWICWDGSGGGGGDDGGDGGGRGGGGGFDRGGFVAGGNGGGQHGAVLEGAFLLFLLEPTVVVGPSVRLVPALGVGVDVVVEPSRAKTTTTPACHVGNKGAIAHAVVHVLWQQLVADVVGVVGQRSLDTTGLPVA